MKKGGWGIKLDLQRFKLVFYSICQENCHSTFWRDFVKGAR